MAVVDKQSILDQIDRALDRWTTARGRSIYDDLSDLHEESIEVITLLAATIERVAPKASRYRQTADGVLDKGSNRGSVLQALVGVLRALRADVDAGYLQTVQELVHAGIFADFLEMADHLLAEGYKDAAAVLAGGVLEEHLRQLCDKAGVPTQGANRPKKADTLNADLAGAGTYSKLDQKNVTAWLDLRNNAAHGRYGEYTDDQVALLLQSIRDFITRVPA